MNHKQKNNPIIGIAIGDINGIGTEVLIKALSDKRIFKYVSIVVYGSSQVLSYHKKVLRTPDNMFTYGQIKSISHINHKHINVITCWSDDINIKLGIATPQSAKAAISSLNRAMTDLKNGVLSAIVTAPINKSNIQQHAIPEFVGHTQYLTQELGSNYESLMMMVSDTVKVGVVTNHLPLQDVSKTITKQLIEKKLTIFINSLKKDFNIPKPKIAVLSLNPHAGENGLLGNEEQKIINPTVIEFKKQGNLVFGPFAADGFWGAGNYTKFDGVLAMYHDQGLIPFKLLNFETGVNYTAGLPIIRTSPCHGVNYDLAGKGIANEHSMREAIYCAAKIVKQRLQNSEKN